MKEKITKKLYKEAYKSYKKNEVPVGAIIIKDNKIIAKAHNNRQTNYDILGHAEINCIKKAERKIRDWRLDDCEMYVSLVPCEMCQMIIKKTRLKRVYYILDNSKEEKIIKNLIQTNDCIIENKKYKNLLEKFFKNMRK